MAVPDKTLPAATRPRRILFLDAYDSFTNNIVALLKDVLGCQLTVQVLHMDLKTFDSDPSPDWTPDEFVDRLAAFDAVVCGPGPGSPLRDADVGAFKLLWQQDAVPVLGICLGFQSLVVHFGGSIRRLRRGGLHGLVRVVEPMDSDVFCGVPAFGATLYHSLCADIGQDDVSDADWPVARRKRPACAPELVPLAWTREGDERILMAVRHASRPFWGIQYHPESVRTDFAAHEVVSNWFRAALESNERMGRRRVDGGSFACVDSLHPSAWALNAAQLRLGACPWRSDMQSGLAAEGIRPRYSCRRVPVPLGVNAADVAELLGLDASTEAIILDSSSSIGRGDKLARNSIIALGVEEALRLEYHVGNDYVSLRVPATRDGQERSQRIRLGIGPDGKTDPSSPWHIMSEFWRRRWIPDESDQPVFKGGFLGFVTYEMGLSTLSPGLVARDRGHRRPDVCMAWVTRSVVLDHKAGAAYVQALSTAQDDDDSWMEDVAERLSGMRPGEVAPDEAGFVDNEALLREVRMDGGRVRFAVPVGEEYEDRVRRCQGFIADGESYELCLTAQSTVRRGSKHDCGHDWRNYNCNYNYSNHDNNHNDNHDNHNSHNSHSSHNNHDNNHNNYISHKSHNHNHNRHNHNRNNCNHDKHHYHNRNSCNRSSNQNNYNTRNHRHHNYIYNHARSPPPNTPWQIYRTLRGRQPAPFGTFTRLGGATIIGSSPERFLQHSGRTGACTMRPMKGTVRKSPSVATLAQAEALLHVPKEEAENVMIVDLVCHDLTAVCGAGRVRVSDLLRVEEFVGVWQMSTVVRGMLPAPGDDAGEKNGLDGSNTHPTGFDVLAATLPPGSMTGAPKKRSCEILSSMERSERSIYSGVVGYVDVCGRADWCVTIRTIFRWEDEEVGDDEVWRIGAGGAVTGLSLAEWEREEMEVKLCGPLRVLRDVL